MPFANLDTFSESEGVGDTLYFVHPSPTAGSNDDALFAIDNASNTPRLVRDYAQADSQDEIKGLFNSGGQLYLFRRHTLKSGDEVIAYTAMKPDGTGKDLLTKDADSPRDGNPGVISAPTPLVLPEKQELVVFDSELHLLGPKGEIDHWNPAKPTGKLSLTQHIAGGQSDIQFKLVFVELFYVRFDNQAAESHRSGWRSASTRVFEFDWCGHQCFAEGGAVSCHRAWRELGCR